MRAEHAGSKLLRCNPTREHNAPHKDTTQHRVILKPEGKRENQRLATGESGGIWLVYGRW